MVQVQRTAEKFTTADQITGARLVLTGAIAVVGGLDASHWLIGSLAAAALLSDLVDGRVARATGTVSECGARLDAETDAALILVLSGLVALQGHPWVLAIGLARYVFGLVFAAVPVLRTPPTAPRPWCKVVAASTGIVLAFVAAVPAPSVIATVLLAFVGLLLLESFLHEAVDRARSPRKPLVVPYPTILAFAVVWVAFVAPAAHDHFSVQTLLRLPVELLLVVALALVPARRTRVALSVLVGLALTVLLVVTALDIGFQTVFDRNFDPGGDWSYLGPGVDVLGDSIGLGWARVVAALAGLAVVGLALGVPAALVRTVEVARRRRRASIRSGVVVAAAWGLCASVGFPVVSSGAASLVVVTVDQVRLDITDSSTFGHEIDTDAYAIKAASEPADLVAGLAGKDVLVVFVESYGRVAVQDTTFSPAIDKVLDTGTRQLDKAGYAIRTGFLTSPTFGAGSWLAHSTLQSGLWVNSQRRYNQLLGQKRTTLTSLFGDAGWHTVFDVPADTADWPEGKTYYGFQQYYDSRNVGYAGPKFGYAPIPDQYTLARFRQDQLVPEHRRPVMAEIDLVSSHHPWTPLPKLVPWDEVGDGSIYFTMPQTPTSTQVFSNPDAVKRMYGKSVQYTWQALTSFLTTYRDPNLVMVVLGDHQPHTYVSGEHVGHDVPISIIAQDPKVVARLSSWDWQPQLRPTPDAPVWRMDTFRDRFLAAFSR